MVKKRTLKNIIMSSLLFPFLAFAGAYTGEQLMRRYNPEVALAQDRGEVRGMGLNAYTALGGLAGLAAAGVGMRMEFERDKEMESKENNSQY